MATSARLEELQQKFNENPRRYFAPLANEHRKLGDLDQAITLCRTHLPQQPQHVSGHIVLAQALFEAGNTPDARQAFELALDLDPENLIALRFLGDIARQQGDHLTARQWYERVLDADPRNDEIAKLVREIENGAAVAPPPSAAAAAPEAVAAPLSSGAITEPEPHAAYVPNEPEAESAVPEPAAPVRESAAPVEDLATAWQHEVAALDAPNQAETSVAEPYAEAPPEEPPVAEAVTEVVPERAEAPEPVAEFAEQQPEPDAQPSTAEPVTVDSADEPNEPWTEPAPEFVAGAPLVASTTPPPPPAFAEIDYSLFEAVADDDVVATPAQQRDDEPREEMPSVAPATGDDWFAMPSGRDGEVHAPEQTAESSFDLDAAFQSVLPNKQEPGETQAEQEPAPDLADLPHSREWAVSEVVESVGASSSEEPAFTTSLGEPDSVDDAFAELDRLTASLETEASGSGMLLPDEEYTAADSSRVTEVDAPIARTPESGVSAVESTPIAFVTETMAELYLQQGFREEALAVYRQLLGMNPGDQVLAARVRALEGALGAGPAAPSVDESASLETFRFAAPTARPDAAGQSMRAFLGVFARRRAPMRRRERVEQHAQVAAAPTAPEQPQSGLSALFGGSPGSDDGAAAVLAGAFAQPNAESELLPGRPTRAAAQELSLGDVFGSGSSQGARAASFDEFFSTGTADQSVRSPLDEEGSDMEQFTAWLEGLKKK